MAALLLCVVAGALATGCLLPQDDHVISELPPQRNSPIRIVDYSPATPIISAFRTSTECFSENAPFALTVEDLDLGDRVRSLWYVDYRPDTSGGVETEPVPFNRSQLTISAPTSNLFRGQLIGLSPTIFHTVTVFVTDTEFRLSDTGVTAADTTVLLPNDAGTVIDEGYLDSFTWLLQIEACQ